MAPLLKRLPPARRPGRLPDGKTKDAAKSALSAIAGLGPSAKDALPQVLPLLADPDPAVKALAFEAVAALGDPSAAPQVASAFADEQKRVAALRADWVGAPLPKEYGKGFEPAVRALSDSPAAAKTAQRTADMLDRVAELDRERAAAAGKILRQERAPQELVADAEPEQLAPFAAGLEAMGAVNAEGAQAILDGYRDDDSADLRRAAYVGLARLGGAALKDAENGLFDASLEVRTATTDALGHAGKAGQQALADVLPKLTGDHLAVLRDMDGAQLDAGVVPELVKEVQEGGADSALAAHLLGQMKAGAALPVLLKVIDDPTAAAQREAIWALGQIGDRKAAEVVARELLSESADLRAAAAEALGQIGSAAQVPALEALKGDYYVRVRDAAGAALAKLKGPAAVERAK